MLNLASGWTFNLDDVGARMWELLAQHAAVEPAYQSLLLEYDVEPDRLKSDLVELVDQLAAHGMLAFEPPHPAG